MESQALILGRPVESPKAAVEIDRGLESADGVTSLVTQQP